MKLPWVLRSRVETDNGFLNARIASLEDELAVAKGNLGDYLTSYNKAIAEITNLQKQVSSLTETVELRGELLKRFKSRKRSRGLLVISYCRGSMAQTDLTATQRNLRDMGYDVVALESNADVRSPHIESYK